MHICIDPKEFGYKTFNRMVNSQSEIKSLTQYPIHIFLLERQKGRKERMLIFIGLSWV